MFLAQKPTNVVFDFTKGKITQTKRSEVVNKKIISGDFSN